MSTKDEHRVEVVNANENKHVNLLGFMVMALLRRLGGKPQIITEAELSAGDNSTLEVEIDPATAQVCVSIVPVFKGPLVLSNGGLGQIN